MKDCVITNLDKAITLVDPLVFGILFCRRTGKIPNWQNSPIFEESQRQAVMMITHDADEAIFMSDRIVLMTNDPRAKIGEILQVAFSHPRDRHAMRETKEYYDLRNHALDFLERNFTADK